MNYINIYDSNFCENKKHKIEHAVYNISERFLDYNNLCNQYFYDITDNFKKLYSDDTELLKDIIFDNLDDAKEPLQYTTFEYLIAKKFITLEYEAFTSIVNYLFYIESHIKLSKKYREFIEYLNTNTTLDIIQIDIG